MYVDKVCYSSNALHTTIIILLFKCIVYAACHLILKKKEIPTNISIIILLGKFTQPVNCYNVLLQSNPQTWHTMDRRRNSTTIGQQ